jgi:hypothetical protein
VEQWIQASSRMGELRTGMARCQGHRGRERVMARRRWRGHGEAADRETEEARA